jgi:hypothetical protein
MGKWEKSFRVVSKGQFYFFRTILSKKILKNKIPLNPPLAKGESELASRGIFLT